MVQFKTEFEIEDKVYHVTPESDQGIVTDITYRHSSGIVWYHVTFNPDRGEIPCRDFELSRDKIII